MLDALFFGLSNAGFKVSKQVPFGSLEMLMPYLIRRAEENRGLLVVSGFDRQLIWFPSWLTLAACIEHLKDKGDSELALEILRICREQGFFSAAAYDRLLSYVHGEIPETNALNLMEGDYHLKIDEVADGQKEAA